MRSKLEQRNGITTSIIYIQTIRNLAACDVHMICYSFKPIFGWAKTNLFYQNEDGSFSLLYDQAVVDDMEPSEMYTLIHSQSKGFQLPGWEEGTTEKVPAFDGNL
ncbi:MAG: mannonate dehydratase [Enterococcus casseliflavus]